MAEQEVIQGVKRNDNRTPITPQQAGNRNHSETPIMNRVKKYDVLKKRHNIHVQEEAQCAQEEMQCAQEEIQHA